MHSTGQEHHGRHHSVSTLLRRHHNSTTNNTISIKMTTARDTTATTIRATDNSTMTGTLPQEARPRGIPMDQALAVRREGHL